MEDLRMVALAKQWEDLESQLHKIISEEIDKFQANNGVIIKDVVVKLHKEWITYAHISDVKIYLDFERTLEKVLLDSKNKIGE